MSMATDCIEWTGARDKDGYGKRRYQGKVWLAHRVAWTETNGPIPDGLGVLHHCDNPPCINVEHLFLGTQRDNVIDMSLKGRNHQQPKQSCPKGHPYVYDYGGHGGGRQCKECRLEAQRAKSSQPYNGAKTHCKRGHEFTPENTRPRPRNRRECRACVRAYEANRSR